MKLELLAPARDAEVARTALLCGADAVYIGGPHHGARATAGNSIDDIARVAEMAHLYGARVYVTLNTIIYDSELAQVERTVTDLYRIGVDALIIQDMALLKMDLPPIDLHASTQCDIRTPKKAAFLAEKGFSQLVLPREMSLREMRQVREAVPADVALEAFVHGALCVSYSGDCHASCAALGRSANRGECAQMCRMAYDLTDAQGRVIIANRHFLSLRDLNRIDRLSDMAQAGISSFKIEGRLKDAAYVANVVSAYRSALDQLIASEPEKYQRASFGTPHVPFRTDIDSVFNRGFTSYFIDGRPSPDTKMANLETPKWIGAPVGIVRSVEGPAQRIIADLTAELHNGDGLTYRTSSGQWHGFRLNRIEGNRLYPASPVTLSVGDVIYRNRDTQRDAELASARITRTIAIDMALSPTADGRVSLTLRAENGSSVTAASTCELAEARSDQHTPRQRALSKLGDTPFVIRDYRDQVAPMAFIPASALSALRREACLALSSTIRLNHRYAYRRKEQKSKFLFSVSPLIDYHSNVANALSRQFYLDNGAKKVEDAMEVSGKKDGRTVMTTRYCLRRELGACLRSSDGQTELPRELYLRNDAATYKLCFDCDACQMKLLYTK